MAMAEMEDGTGRSNDDPVSVSGQRQLDSDFKIGWYFMEYPNKVPRAFGGKTAQQDRTK